MREQPNNKEPTRAQSPWEELQSRLFLAGLALADAVVVVVVALSEGVLHWLKTLPFLGEVMDLFGPIVTAAVLVQLVILLAGFTAHQFLTTWERLHREHGGPKPNLAIAVIVTSALFGALVWYLPHEQPDLNSAGVVPDPQTPQVERGGVPRSTPGQVQDPNAAPSPDTQPHHLATVFRLQRPIRGVGRSPQQFVVGSGVTEIELKTPVAYALFKVFTLVLDGQESKSFQVRNSELSLMVDRQALPAGKHTLAVRERQNISNHTDVQIFEFEIVDAPE